jgi:sugar transferase EpsL
MMQTSLLERKDPQRGWQFAVKQLLDYSCAVLGLICVSPVLIVTAILIRLNMGSPVLFRQVRPGKDARVFTLLKFRTMSELRDDSGKLLVDDMRLTKLGQFLRKYSVDELPQLINVLRGELSLVGPRPLLVKYLELYSRKQSRRHAVMPGISGLAQISGRNRLSWEERLELDVWYVDHWSLWLDLKILLKTVVSLIRTEGINSDGHATMPEFLGSKHGPRN